MEQPLAVFTSGARKVEARRFRVEGVSVSPVQNWNRSSMSPEAALRKLRFGRFQFH